MRALNEPGGRRDDLLLLRRGLKALGLGCEPNRERALLVHLELLREWNGTYNLTAIDAADAVAGHVLDSLSAAPWIRGRRVLDVGSGAGFPGLPLAVVQPRREYWLLDGRGKKVRFIETVIRRAGIENAHALHERVETLVPGEPGRPPHKFDTLVTRAFAALPETVRLCRRLLRDGGRMVAMKGARPDREIDAVAGEDALSIGVHRVEVPFLDAERHVVTVDIVQ